MKSSKCYAKGLTLIELMITLAILGVIAAIAIPAYNGYISTARETEGWNNLRALQVAQEQFYSENNSYFTGANYSTLQTASGNLWRLAELNSSGTDADASFNYSATLTATGYSLTATGKGGKVPTTVVLKITK
jgi:type IV pilus assembly protein PilE